MEENFDDRSLRMDPLGESLLASAAKWAQFIAVMTFVGAAIAVIMALTASLWFGTLRNTPGMEATGIFAMGSGMFTTTYLIVGLIYFLFAFFLYHFADRAQRAQKTRDGAALNESVASLGTYFRVQGVLMIVGMVFVAFALVAGTIGGAATAILAM